MGKIPVRRQRGFWAIFCAVSAAGLSAKADINFAIPADAPDGGNGTVGILRVTNNGTVNGGVLDNQDQARASLTSGGTRTAFSAPYINHLADGGGIGHYGFDLDYGSGDNKAYLFRGNIKVTTPGTYTFNIASDDGFTLAFNNGTVPFANAYNGTIDKYNGNTNGALTFFPGRGTADTGAQVTFATAGTYHFDMTFHDGCCGDSVELTAAPGAKGGFDNSFKLVGGSPAFKKFKTVGAWDTYTFANVNSMAATITAYNNASPTAFRSRTSEQTIAFYDPQNNGVTNGHAGDARAYPADDPGADDNNFGVGARATFTVAAADAGVYSLLVNSDDGFRLRVLDGGGNPVTPFAGPNTIVDDTTKGLVPANGPDACCTDFIGKYSLAAGTYTLEVIHNEMSGGAGLLVYGAQGDLNEFNPAAFQLIGANIYDPTPVSNAAFDLVAAPEPGTLGVCAVVAVAGLARRRRTGGAA